MGAAEGAGPGGADPQPDPADAAAEDGREEVGGRRSPLRRCVATGRVGPKETMVRFVLGPGDVLVPDVEGRLPGRGYWVSADRAAMERAVAKRSFSRAARRPVEVPADLAERTAALLRKRCLDRLGLARRAGQLVAGYEKVREALVAGRVALRIEAADGSPDGRDKLTAAARGVPVVSVFSAWELADALGRAHVVHAALAPGGFAERLLEDLARYRGAAGPDGPASDTELGSGRTTI